MNQDRSSLDFIIPFWISPVSRLFFWQEGLQDGPTRKIPGDPQDVDDMHGPHDKYHKVASIEKSH